MTGWRRTVATLTIFSILFADCAPAFAQSSSENSRNAGQGNSTSAESGVVHLNESSQAASEARASPKVEPAEAAAPYHPGEFERFVQQMNLGGLASDQPIRRFGAELLTDRRGDAVDYAPQVPPDYVIAPGDEIAITMWGAVDANLRLTVDRSGNLNLPRVGAILVSGTRYGDLSRLLTERVGRSFKNFQLSASLGQLRSIRIYVTGYTKRPGSYTVSSLSTIVDALMRTGGPSAAGSFRNIQLRRRNAIISTFDLYDLLLHGDKSADVALQAEDVVFIAPVGPQAAVVGSVNKPAIFELKAGETLDDLLHMAGGFTSVADESRVLVERLEERNQLRVRQVELPAGSSMRPGNGDVVQALSAVGASLPMETQNKRIHVEGEVARPGDVVLPPGSTLADALRAAGGLTPAAYVFGTDLSRVSVRVTQEANYDRALRDLETEFTRISSARSISTSEDAQAQSQQTQSVAQLIDRLRHVRPTGRIVLEMDPLDPRLPDLSLEDGDRIRIPPVPATVGIFGSVYNGGNYLYRRGTDLDRYVHLAGGAKKGADPHSAFVIRASGTVISASQAGSWFNSRSGLADIPAEPGDTIFMPEDLDKTDYLRIATQWTQILFQFGLGAAALKTINQ